MLNDKITQSLECYQVGGVVRDKILNTIDNTIYPKEVDWVVVGSSREEMLQLGFRTVGKYFPVFLHPNTNEEYALARHEKKVGKGYHGFDFLTDKVSLIDDLARRDLTINAIAFDGKKHIDPYHGRQDIDKRILQHISLAFSEDPLRVFRVARFHARFAHLGFRIAQKTLDLMTDICCSGELKQLSATRVWKETELGLQSHSPRVYFNTLKKIGALKEWYSEIDNLFGVPQPANWHPEIDCGIHTLMVLEHASKNNTQATIRFAALTHDLGKATTPKEKLPSHKGHEKRGIKQIKSLCQRLKTPKKFEKLALITAQWHTHFHLQNSMKAETFLKVLLAIDYFRRPENLHELLVVTRADSNGRTGFQFNPYPQQVFWIELVNSFKKINMDSSFMALSPSDKKQWLHNERLKQVQSFLNNNEQNN